tara:strand:- start:374 stop:703 length:330 start_codon:yes stop_codon:yes gene_type:complete
MGLFSKKPQWKKDVRKRPLFNNEIESALTDVIPKIKSEKKSDFKEGLHDISLLYLNLVSFNTFTPENVTEKNLKLFKKEVRRLMNMTDEEWNLFWNSEKVIKIMNKFKM